MNNIELKPCKRCGGEAQITILFDPYAGVSSVSITCRECGANKNYGFCGDKSLDQKIADAAEDWNNLE